MGTSILLERFFSGRTSRFYNRGAFDTKAKGQRGPFPLSCAGLFNRDPTGSAAIRPCQHAVRARRWVAVKRRLNEQSPMQERECTRDNAPTSSRSGESDA